MGRECPLCRSNSDVDLFSKFEGVIDFYAEVPDRASNLGVPKVDLSPLRMIAACRDGDGVVIDKGAIENIGNIVWISNGAVVEAPGRVC